MGEAAAFKTLVGVARFARGVLQKQECVMTRHELQSLRDIVDAIESRPEMAAMGLRRVIAAAECEHADEDAHHDMLESKDRPVNLHMQAAE